MNLISRAIRLPLKLIPQSSVVPILMGPGRGSKWIVGSSLHGMWLGTFERNKRALFSSYIKPGMTVFDIGAHAGLYTIISSLAVGRDGMVYSFEPNQRNVVLLKQHIALNHLSNVKVIEAAVSDHDGVSSFDDAESHIGKLHPAGRVQVKTVKLDDLNIKPDVVKMDIEGGEWLALLGMRNTLSTSRPTIFLATHGKQVANDCRAYLSDLGYSIKQIASDEVLATQTRTKSH